MAKRKSVANNEAAPAQAGRSFTRQQLTMPQMQAGDYLARLINRAAELTRPYERPATIFADLVAALVAMMRFDVDEARRLNEKYMAAAEPLGEILGYWMRRGEIDFVDVIGPTYEALQAHNKGAGQFFTPYDLAKLMAQLQMDDCLVDGDKPIDGRPIWIDDPAVGAGGLLLAAAECLQLPAQQHRVWFFGTDIDPLCADMARVNLWLHNLFGFVRCGSSLRDPIFELRPELASQPPAIYNQMMMWRFWNKIDDMLAGLDGEARQTADTTPTVAPADLTALPATDLFGEIVAKPKRKPRNHATIPSGQPGAGEQLQFDITLDRQFSKLVGRNRLTSGNQRGIIPLEVNATPPRNGIARI